MNWAIARNSDLLIPLSLQPNVVFPTMNSDGSKLKYQRVTTTGFRDISVRKLGFVAKTQFLYGWSKYQNLA